MLEGLGAGAHVYKPVNRCTQVVNLSFSKPQGKASESLTDLPVFTYLYITQKPVQQHLYIYLG